MELADDPIDIVAPPIIDGLEPAGIATEGGRIGQLLLARRVGIEIVIHVDGLNIVAADKVLDDHANPITGLVKARIEIPLAVVLPKPIAVGLVDMVLPKRRNGIACEIDTIGIEPHVDRHVPQMGLFDHEFERVPHFLLAPSALLARKPMADRLQLRQIEGVGRGAHLKDNGVDTDVPERIEQPH